MGKQTVVCQTKNGWERNFKSNKMFKVGIINYGGKYSINSKYFIIFRNKVK